MSQADAAKALAELGFTGLESEIYAFLVRESPATGYRIAQAIGKPVANTYKAIQTLQAKGAIEVEDGETRLCRAVPSAELLDRLGREFESRRAQAKDLLGKLGTPPLDDRIYQLRSATQVLQRARETVQTAKRVVLLAAPRATVLDLTDAIAAATARGVQVLVKTTGEVTLAKVEVFVATRADDLVHHSQFLRLVADGEQLLSAHLNEENTTALWTRNPALALPAHEGLAAEISLLAVADRIEDGAGPKRIVRALTTAPTASETPGYRSV